MKKSFLCLATVNFDQLTFKGDVRLNVEGAISVRLQQKGASENSACKVDVKHKLEKKIERILENFY